MRGSSSKLLLACEIKAIGACNAIAFILFTFNFEIAAAQEQESEEVQQQPPPSLSSSSASVDDRIAEILQETVANSTRSTMAARTAQYRILLAATITWTNDDSQPHTATSGENAQTDGRFDSGIIASTTTFEHTFTEPGEYPYF
jgi:plastocyanin